MPFVSWLFKISFFQTFSSIKIQESLSELLFDDIIIPEGNVHFFAHYIKQKLALP